MAGKAESERLQPVAALGKSRPVPSWVPAAAVHYLAHTETGTPIRALARSAGCHASTVLRQVRACESRRDDLLVDEALRRLGQQVTVGAKSTGSSKEASMPSDRLAPEPDCDAALSEARLIAEARPVLRDLSAAGAVLAVSLEMEKAVVVAGDSGRGGRAVAREIAEAMALKRWIACDRPGRIARYHITATGRSALGRMLADAENRALGMAEAQLPFAMVRPAAGAERAALPSARRARFEATETPLAGLARRRDRDGQPFLAPDLVRAGERLREDFELAQMGARVTQNWDRFLCAVDDRGASPCQGTGIEAARTRVIGALRDLGPGLGDVVLRCCCYLEGLEHAEQRMGWSARSGKIVLRIALQRLKRHYDRLGDPGQMIG